MVKLRARLRRQFRERSALVEDPNPITPPSTKNSPDTPEDNLADSFVNNSISNLPSRQTDHIYDPTPARKNRFQFFRPNRSKGSSPTAASPSSDVTHDEIPDDVDSPLPPFPSLVQDESSRIGNEHVSFIPPSDWMAVRVSDGFSILNGMAVGFVRAVAAEDAVHALLETERLQVVSHVSALSSPVFNNKDLEVRYVAHGGAGLGMAWFTGSGACVVAVCGPSEVSRVVEQAITDLRKSVVLLEVPKREGVEEDKAEEKVAESVTTHDCSIQ